MLRACTVCGALSPKPRCPEHKGRQRNGSTRAWRKVRAEVLERDHHRCFYCGRPANTVDHLKPVAQGGTDDKDNLVAACSQCNGAKGDRTADQFG
jgi:5-methylcytosine-specific restriction endonuclease McrA